VPPLLLRTIAASELRQQGVRQQVIALAYGWNSARVLDLTAGTAYYLNKKNLSPRLLRSIMPGKNKPSIFQKLGDLLETRVDISAFLQELLFGPRACSRLSRRTFGYTPAIIAPTKPTSVGARARLLSFPVHQSRVTKAL
jgi:hypothetical protein